MKLFLKLIKFIGEILFVLAAFLIFLGFAYYFSETLLRGPMNWGSDIPYVAGLVKYLIKWYPPIPSWDYLASGGMSFLAPYPPIPTLITFFYHMATGWPVMEVMRFLAWLSVPIAACGIAVLTRLLTKNWFIGILAGVMLFFSPDTWLWMTFGGFYAFSLAVPVFAWSIVFFVLAFKQNRRLLWVLSVISVALIWLFHPMDGVLSVMVLLILGIGLAGELKEKWYRGLIKALLVIGFGGLAAAWWLIPFYIARQNGGVSAEGLAYIPLKELIGLTPPADSYITSTFFAASVALLAGVGAVAAFIRKSIIRYVVVICLIAIFIATCVGFLPRFMIDLMNLLLRSTNVRAAVVLRILGPVVAAYGAASIARPFFWSIERGIKSLAQNRIWKIVTEILCGAVGFFVFAYAVKTVIVKPYYSTGQVYFYQGFGPLYNWLSVVDKNGVKYSDLGKLYPSVSEIVSKISSWKMQVDDVESFLSKGIADATKQSGLTNKDRIDIGLYSSSIAVALNGAVDVTQIPAVVGIRLITRMVGWQVDCFYINTSCQSTDIEDLSRWFGISAVWTGPSGIMGSTGENSLNKIKASPLFNHEIYNFDIDGNPYQWNSYVFTGSTGLASYTNKPLILVIGNNPPNNDVYDTVFRDLSKFKFGYANAWSIKGKEYIDDYELSELRKFKIIILDGYHYHSSANAWKLLEDYVNAGGNLMMDTGWQYMNSDWGKIAKDGTYQAINMPAVVPVSQTIWGDIGKTWNMSISQDGITNGVGADGWGDLIWKGQPWGVAFAQPDWLRPDAKTLLSDNGKVLVAGWNYGKGKVIWTGFDFWGHSTYYRSVNEELFVNRILTWLAGSTDSVSEQKLDFTRESPDLVKINLNSQASGMKLMFKEVNSPGWSAKVFTSGKQSNLKMYSAGPGWRMVFLPEFKGNSYLTFIKKNTFWESLGIAISVITFVGLILFIFNLHVRFLGKIKSFINANLKKNIEKVKDQWQDEQE